MKRVTLILLIALIFGSPAYADIVPLNSDKTIQIQTDDGTIVVPVKVKKRSVALALGLSLIMPGTGQLYTGDYIDGAVHLIGASFAWDNYIRTDSKFTLFCCLTLHIISAIDAPLEAHRFNKAQPKLGHLIEIPGDRFTLGIDPITARETLGTKFSLRF